MAMQSLTEVTSNRNSVMSSREIAELTGKQHAHVMRDLRAMLEQLKADPNLDWHCESSTYDDAQGKSREMYLLDKNTTIALISGYDAILRMRIINRWQELESQSQFKLPQSFSEALQLAADQAKQIEYQNGQIAVMTPKAEYYDLLIGSEELMDGEEAAKFLRTSRQKLFAFLKERGVLTKSNLPMQLYIDKDFMRIKPTLYTDFFGNPKTSLKVVFTQRGIQYIRVMFDDFINTRDLVIA